MKFQIITPVKFHEGIVADIGKLTSSADSAVRATIYAEQLGGYEVHPSDFEEVMAGVDRKIAELTTAGAGGCDTVVALKRGKAGLQAQIDAHQQLLSEKAVTAEPPAEGTDEPEVDAGLVGQVFRGHESRRRATA